MLMDIYIYSSLLHFWCMLCICWRTRFIIISDPILATKSAQSGQCGCGGGFQLAMLDDGNFFVAAGVVGFYPHFYRLFAENTILPPVFFHAL